MNYNRSLLIHRSSFIVHHSGVADMEMLLSAERIQQRVDELARRIAADFHGRPTTIVGVLTGCLMFLSDLVRRIDLPLRIGLVQASSYRGAAVTPGALRIGPDLMPDVRDRHVL